MKDMLWRHHVHSMDSIVELHYEGSHMYQFPASASYSPASFASYV